MKKKFYIFNSIFAFLIMASFYGCSGKGSKGQLSEQIISDNKKYGNFISAADKYLSENDFSGAVLVAKKNEIIFAKGYGVCDLQNADAGSNTINTVFEAGSLTKQMTAAAVLQLEKKKKLRLDDKIDSYFPEFERGKDITIRMLLNMRSGLTDCINAGAEFFPINIYRAIEQNQLFCTPVDDNLVLAYLPTAPFIAKPGSTYFYCNTNYWLLAKIIEQASGKDYHDYMTKKILKKCHMTHSNFEFQNTDAKGYVGGVYYSIPAGLSLGCGDLNSNVLDLYRWNCAFISGKIVPKSVIKKLRKSKGYNYGFNCGNKMIFHAGSTNVFNSYNSYNFKNGASVIVLCNRPMSECNATAVAGKLSKLLMR